MFSPSNILKKSRYLALIAIIPGCSLLNTTFSSEAKPTLPPMGTSGRLETTKYLGEAQVPAKAIAVTPYIRVDQFGYRPQDPKIAVISDPQHGFNSGDYYNPGQTIEIRRWQDSSTVKTATPQAWNQGQVQSSSGDRGWWVDFSEITESGHYYLYDPTTKKRSHPFLIDSEVYYPILKAAVRTFYYNRSNFAKEYPYADKRWVDKASFLGRKQDLEARYVNDKKNSNLKRDLSGGWWDAGDTNKYVTFTSEVIHQLVDAYQRNPKVFTDDFNLPESGNGIPDLIDEIKYEIDWIKKMQEADGGVLLKVGTIDYKGFTPKSRDPRPRYYVGKCSSSTIVAAGHFARAASLYKEFPQLQSEIPDLTQRAQQAWQWYHANPKRDDCDTQEVKSGDADRPLEIQQGDAVVAAIYLYALTGDAEYHDYIKQNYQQTKPFNGDRISGYSPHHGDALMFYTTLTNKDPQLAKTILDKKITEAKSDREFYGFYPEKDLYRSFLTSSAYHWGSNSIRASRGSSNYDVVFYDLLPGLEQSYEAAALNTVHYFHGVNPLGMVYLTNMYDYGAESSANEIHHEWYADNSPWDSAIKSPRGPAPGYIVGGPNQNYTGNYQRLKNQPPQKMYADWNSASNNDKSWEITEPAIYYQSAYIKLLAHFVE